MYKDCKTICVLENDDGLSNEIDDVLLYKIDDAPLGLYDDVHSDEHRHSYEMHLYAVHLCADNFDTYDNLLSNVGNQFKNIPVSNIRIFK